MTTYTRNKIFLDICENYTKLLDSNNCKKIFFFYGPVKTSVYRAILGSFMYCYKRTDLSVNLKQKFTLSLHVSSQRHAHLPPMEYVKEDVAELFILTSQNPSFCKYFQDSRCFVQDNKKTLNAKMGEYARPKGSLKRSCTSLLQYSCGCFFLEVFLQEFK